MKFEASPRLHSASPKRRPGEKAIIQMIEIAINRQAALVSENFTWTSDLEAASSRQRRPVNVRPG
jgi:hypothetical protein